jgi:hypothetical protein
MGSHFNSCPPTPGRVPKSEIAALEILLFSKHINPFVLFQGRGYTAVQQQKGLVGSQKYSLKAAGINKKMPPMSNLALRGNR